MSISRCSMPLASSVYHQSLGGRRRQRVHLAQLAGMDSIAAGRALRKLLPDFDRDDHVAAAAYHLERAERLDRAWSKVAERAAVEAFGRSWQFHDYRICAIGREEFSNHHKRVLRHCAYNSTKHRDLAHAHTRAAGLRKLRELSH